MYVYDPTLLIGSGIVGLIPAVIAQNKGRNFIGWWVFGFLCFILALIIILCLPPIKECGFCGRTIHKKSLYCPFCGNMLVKISNRKESL